MNALIGHTGFVGSNILKQKNIAITFPAQNYEKGNYKIGFKHQTLLP